MLQRPPEVDFLHSWAVVLRQIFRQIVSISSTFYSIRLHFKYKCGGIKAYKKGRGLASGCWRMSLSWTLYVATKTSRIPRNLNLVGETTLLGGTFCLEYPSRRSEKVNCHFLNYRLSFRKLKIVISQTADFHFANYRLSFRKLQIVISQTADFHFANCRFSFCKLQSFISQTADFHFANCRVSFRKLQIFISFHFVSFHFVSQTSPRTFL